MAKTSNANTSAILAHLRLPVQKLAPAIKFFEALGGTQDVDRDGFAVVELADRTRVQLSETADAELTGNYLQFDFKVADFDDAWRDYQDKGLKPSDIVRNRPGHDFFILTGPDNCEVRINSNFNRI